MIKSDKEVVIDSLAQAGMNLRELKTTGCDGG